MTPHQHFVRDLRTTTALHTSARFIVSENVREIRDRQRADYLIPVAPSFYRHLQKAIERRQS